MDKLPNHMQPAPKWPPRWDTPIFQEGDGEIPDASHSWFAQGVDCGSFKMALGICSGTQGPFLVPRGTNTAVGMAPSGGRDVQLQCGPLSPTADSGKMEWNGMLSHLTSSRRSSSRMRA